VIRCVRPNGQIKWQGADLYLSQVIAGQPVGLDAIDDGRWRLYYGMLPLATLDARTARGARIEPLNPKPHHAP